jgi:hypothetical protein
MLGILVSTGYIVLFNPFALNKEILNTMLLIICVFLYFTFLGLAEINFDELTVKSIIGTVLKWAFLFIPLALLGFECDLSNIYKHANIIILIVNLLIWIIFTSNYSIELKDKRNLNHSNSSIVFTSIWLLIGLFKYVGDNSFFHFAVEPINNLKAIYYLLNLKTLFFGGLIIYGLIYVVSNIGDEKPLKIPQIPTSKAETENITSYDWINSIFTGLQFFLNILISVLNPPIQIIGTVLIYFLYIIPKLVIQLIFKLGKLSLLILPSIAILVLVLSLVYLIRENSESIIIYLQTTLRADGLTYLPKLIIFGGLSLILIISIQLINYFSFNPQEKFSLNSLPFSITYFLLLLTVTGWIIYAIGTVSSVDLQIGIFTLVMSIMLSIGILVLMLWQIKSKTSTPKS